ncbi:hypothetical protein IPN35_05750 [Candidatus Peregrinibacteria bacterium]|nr:MAG: hypothetical protein IPN35_05750 [Candidatus Peregrinibacteria bacterium]
MVNIQAILRDFRRLPISMKYVFFGAILGILFVFLPWFQSDQLVSAEGRLQRVADIKSGFGIFPIFGLLSLFFSGGSLLIFIHRFLGSSKTFGISSNKLWTGIGTLAIYTLFINIFVFSSLMQNDSTAQIRFGLFGTILSHTLVLFGGYLSLREVKREEVQSVFLSKNSPFTPNLNIRPEEPHIDRQQLSFSDTDERESSVLR